MSTAAATAPNPTSRKSSPRISAGVVAVVAGVIAVLAAVLTPLLPVTQDSASISWPQNGTLTSVEAPLISYTPLSLDASIPCAVIENAPPGTLVLSTTAPNAPDAQGVGLVVTRTESGMQAVLRERVLLTLTNAQLASCSSVDISSTNTGSTASAPGTDATGAIDGDARPQTVGVFTELQGTAPVDFSVDIQIDSRFSSTPTLLKKLAMAAAVIFTIISLIALHRLDLRDGRRGRRFFPSHWLRITVVDGVVAGVLLLWHFIGANTSDDGYLLTMARVSEHAGYMANYYRWFGVPEAPFGMPYYDMLAAFAKVSTASPWMRLPALIAGLLCWAVISREVIPRLGRAVRSDKVAIWTAGLVFLAFWLPYDNGLRPEPVIALGALLTWCSIERAIATGRLLPAAVAVLIAAFSLAAGPTGLICVAALLAGGRPLVRVLISRARHVGWFPVLLPILASGAVIVAAIFADQTLSTVLEATRARAAVGPNVPWFEERTRWDSLMEITPDGSLARRFAVFAMILCVITTIVVMLRRNGRIPGVALGPSRRIVGIVIGALALMMFTPTKWTHHFGVYAGLAASLAAVAAIAVASATRDNPRNRTLFTAAVLFLTALAFTGSNGWWYVSSYGIPWFDKPPMILGKGFSTVFLGLTVLALLYAGWQHLRTPYRATTRSARFGVSALTVMSAFIVLFELASFVKGAVAQYPAYSVARSNLNALAGNSCSLANDVLVEQDPNEAMLTPIGSTLADSLAGEGTAGFAPDGVPTDLTADEADVSQESTRGFSDDTTTDQPTSTSSGSSGTEGGTTEGTGINGSSVALPFGLDPSRTPVLGSYGADTSEPATLTTEWFSLPAVPDGDFLAISAAGRIRSVDADGIVASGQPLEVEYAAGDQILGRVTPIDIGPQPSWRNLRVPLSEIPDNADRVRLVATDSDISADQWLAVTPPRIPRTVPLVDVIGSDTPVMLDWTVALGFPCQRPFDHKDGVAELPEYRILPDRSGAAAHSPVMDAFGGGPLGWQQLVLSAEVVPTYLRDDLDRDWGSLERFSPLDTSATPAELTVGTVTRSGWESEGPIRVE
ncbi:arabinosyltransferase [Rhodococcus sp. PAMC28707]|uniref:arabinosyltransferase domain-containing protein n=1 Tax=unclassified Rhodococcus (in: high G+C Gram-positive bacteria) TaxID=192944 RepID=UPI00109DEECD|nr:MULTISPECIES: arabinosyltransferase domain-containing protein [unclassified Rhodococcus (in: high G+C Gram-positive bacteria)]QCB49599.1 arabinosyltransferase [Rhodococcus sp. PAMC28705]QCB58711.1 arabinosyltransferase [Rhodococcus sp. PAMC28707]